MVEIFTSLSVVTVQALCQPQTMSSIYHKEMVLIYNMYKYDKIIFQVLKEIAAQ